MVKITREMAERLLCLLAYVHAYCQHPEGEAVNKGYQVARDMVTDRGHKPNRTLQHTAVRGLDAKHIQPDDLFNELVAALHDYEEGASNIISSMVDILSGSNNMNSMVGENIRALRRAILLPSEMAKVQEMLRKEMRCLHCASPLVNGQMVTATDRQGDGMGFYCTTCYAPTSIACGSGCNDVAPIDDGIMHNMIRKAKCPLHGGKAEKQAVVTQDDIADLLQRAARNARQPDEPAPARGIIGGRRLGRVAVDPLFGAAVAPADPNPFEVDNGPLDIRLHDDGGQPAPGRGDE